MSAIGIRDNDANVVCKMFGYASGELGMEPDWDESAYPKKFFILDSPSCTGSEANIHLCPLMVENSNNMKLANSSKSIAKILTGIRCLEENEDESFEKVKQDCITEGVKRTKQCTDRNSKRTTSTKSVAIAVVVSVISVNDRISSK